MSKKIIGPLQVLSMMGFNVEVNGEPVEPEDESGDQFSDEADAEIVDLINSLEGPPVDEVPPPPDVPATAENVLDADVPLEPSTINRIFEEAEHQVDYALALYKEVYPRWDEIEEVDGWPHVSEKTSKYIMQKAIDFDIEHHPDVMNGGLWMNNGFSSSVSRDEEPIADWYVRPAPVILKEDADRERWEGEDG